MRAAQASIIYLIQFPFTYFYFIIVEIVVVGALKLMAVPTTTINCADDVSQHFNTNSGGPLTKCYYVRVVMRV